MAGQGSARVTLREIDLSQVRNPQQSPQGVPAAVVGTARKGPAFVPRTFANMQQFNEVFGSMLEVGKDSNSNLPGPLALNEWMKSAQAGTFLRVLGVGDGTKAISGTPDASLGKVSEAGFVVGQQLVQQRIGTQSAGKVDKNPHASIGDEDADKTNASAAAKTHFLGCFMKDASGSSFLKDAGLEEDSAQSQVTLFLENSQITADSYFIVGGLDASGTTKFFKVLFNRDDDVINHAGAIAPDGTLLDPKVIVVGIASQFGQDSAENQIALLEKIKKALSGKDITDAVDDVYNEEDTSNPSTYFVVGAVDEDAKSISIVQVGAGSLGDTEFQFDVRLEDDSVDSFYFISGDDAGTRTNNSSFNQDMQMTEGAVGAEAEVNTLTVNEVPIVEQHAKETVTVAEAQVQADETFTINDGVSSQTFQFIFDGNGGTIAQDQAAGTITIDADGLNGPALTTAIYNAIDNALTDTNVTSNISEDRLTITDPGAGGTTFVLESVENQLFENGISNFDNATGVSSELTQRGGAADSDLIVRDMFGNSVTFAFTDDNDDATASSIGIQSQAQDLQNADLAVIASQIEASINVAIGNGALKTDALSVSSEGAVVTLTNALAGLPQEAVINAASASVNSGSLTAETTTAGDDGTGLSSITLEITETPDVDQSIIIPTRTVANGAVSTQDYRVLVKEPHPSGNGQNNGLSGLNINVEHDEDINIFAARLQLVFETNSTLSGLYDVRVTSGTDKVTVVIEREAEAGQGHVMNQTTVFNFDSGVTVVGLEEGELGNFGVKTGSFGGGGGGASPIIRGVLMMPQGVKPSMQVNSGLVAAFSNSTSDTDLRDLEIHGKTFGAAGGVNLAGYLVGKVEADQSFELLLNGFSNKEHPAVIKCSFNPDDDSYFAKVLNTDPTKIEEKGHYLYSHWDIDENVAVPSKAGLQHAGAQLSGAYDNMIGFVMAGAGDGAGALPDYNSFEQRFQTAKTPWIVSQFMSVSSNTEARPSSAAAGGAKKLFRLHALDAGEVGNTQFRLLISDLRYNGKNDYGTFTLSLEKFDSDPVRGETIVSWKKADLNPESSNFIGRLIGDEYTYYDFDLDVEKQRLKTKGSYALKNDYVRIELSEEVKQGLVPVDTLPAGFQGHSYLRTSLADNFVEQAGLAADSVYTDSSGAVQSLLQDAKVLPLDYVKSISRLISTSTPEADSDLAWGVKLSVRENKDSDSKELVEQVFNHSVKSWTKFFPELGQSHALESDGDEADKFQNSFFSLENIELGSGDSWNGSKYVRKPAAPEDGARFVTISEDAKGGNVKYLKFRCLFQGGFDGVNIFDQEKAELTSVASVREGQDEQGLKRFTGPTIMAYRRAVDVLADKSAAEFQLLSLPGQRASQVTDYAIDACEDRFDALLVMDIVEKTAETHHVELLTEKPHVRNTISSFEDRSLDSSFAAAYFPDVLMRRPSDSAPVIMPPSVGMMGVMSRNDSIADPWFAPAGLSRGRLGAIDAQVQMNRDLLDELYDADINPVYVPAGRSGEVYAFGQKTLLQDASALDRINVRRLLIDIRRKVKKVGEQLLFEPNRASTLSKFSSLVEPIMANVQQRRGVERYKVQIDTTTTTQNDIENNTIRGKIYLQPTKSVEFISLDFVVANNIQ